MQFLLPLVIHTTYLYGHVYSGKLAGSAPREPVGSCEQRETGADPALKQTSHNFFC